jgi:hypothetical protein
LASASGSGAGRDDEIEEEAEEEADGDDGEEEEEVFDMDEINPPNYVDMGPLVLRTPTNPSWRVKVSYNGKTESMRENMRILARTRPRDAYDYRFHSLFHQDFYELVIMTKSKPVANSQWIDWTYMENKHDLIFDGVIVACQAKHLREILAFKKNWNNEVIAQFYAIVCFKELGDTRKNHWMTKSHWYEVSYYLFARLFGFGQRDASCPRIHLALKLEARKIKFMYPRSKQGNFGDYGYASFLCILKQAI